MKPSTIAENRRAFFRRAACLSAGLALTGPATGAEPATPPAWEIGAYTRPWDQYDLPAALDAIAEAGFQHVGIMTTKPGMKLVLSVTSTPEEARAVGEACRKRKLSVASVYGGDLPVNQSLAAGIAGLRKLIDHCAAAGARNLLLGGTGNQDLHDRYYQAVSEGCAYAREKGVSLSIKPHGGLNSTGPQCRKIIEKVARKNFRLWYDPGNIFYYSNGQLDPVDDAATVDGLVGGMIAKDFLPPKNVHVNPGDGKVNFAKVLTRLRKGGFTGGPLLLETLARGELAEVTTAAKKARLFLEKLVAGTG